MNMNPSTDRSLPASADILFIGNSYTDQIQSALAEAIAESPYRQSTLTTVWQGGVTLQQLVEDGRAFEGIGRQKWDAVVLQEQSQRPAIPGDPRKQFDKAVDVLVPRIREAGAEPLLYMTWGHRDGNTVHPDLVGYEAMQQRLTDAYREAAERNGIRVVPVGEAWAMLRKTAPEFGRLLYQDDGSHPTVYGAYLATCVFLRTLFNDPLDQVHRPTEISDEHDELIRNAVKQTLG